MHQTTSCVGLPLTEGQRQVFEQCTGREKPPTSGTNEAWLVCGRRAGKSFVLALIAVFLAAFKDWRKHLGPGERATSMIVPGAGKTTLASPRRASAKR